MAHFVNPKHNNVCDHPQHTKNVTILETSKESLALACYRDYIKNYKQEDTD